MLRRLLLIAVFLLAQAGALAHGLSHGTAHDDDAHDHPRVCSLCLAFAPLGAGLAGQNPSPALLPVVAAPLQSMPWASSSSPFLACYRSRAPPR